MKYGENTSTTHYFATHNGGASWEPLFKTFYASLDGSASCAGIPVIDSVILFKQVHHKYSDDWLLLVNTKESRAISINELAETSCELVDVIFQNSKQGEIRADCLLPEGVNGANDYRFIFRTDDSGSTWQPLPPPDKAD